MSRPPKPTSGDERAPSTAPGAPEPAQRRGPDAASGAALGAPEPMNRPSDTSTGAGRGGEAGGGSGGGAADGGGRPIEVAIVSIGALSTWRRFGWTVAVLALVAAAIWLAILVPIVSVPLLVSFILAYLLSPIVDRLERWRIRRSLGIAIIILAFLGLMTGLTAMVVPIVADDIRRMPAQLADLIASASGWIESTFGVTVPRTSEEIMDAITQRVDDLEDTENWLGSVAQVVFGRTVGVIGMLLGFVMIPVFTFFLLRDLPRIFSTLEGLVPAYRRPIVVQRVREIDGALSGFIRGQLIVAAVLAVLYSIGLWAVGLPLAILVGVISGIGNLVPFLGTAIGILLATIVAILDWQGFLQLLLVYAVFAIVQALESWLITPNIVGNRVGLSPFAVIVAVLAFGELFGFLGVLLAVPIAAVLKILLRATIDSYRQSSLFRRGPTGQPS